MVKEENAHYYTMNKFVISFLTSSEFATPELIDQWKNKSNLHKLKSTLKKTDKPNYPPRPKSKYIFFCDEIRPQIQGAMREASDGETKINIHEVTCELGRRWKQFNQFPDSEMNQRITQLAEEDKKRYHDEKEAMQKKSVKNDNYLKSKYLYFCKEERDKNSNIKFTDLSILWKVNKDDDKLADRYEAAKTISRKKHEGEAMSVA